MKLTRDRRGISAIYDALLALIIIMIATGIVYEMAVASLSKTSAEGTSGNMDRMADISLPLILDATGPASYTNISNETSIDLGLITTKDMLEVGLVLLRLEMTGAADYDLGPLLKAISMNCRLVLYGWEWALEVSGSGSMLWTGPPLFVGGPDVHDAAQVPDPRSVNTMTVAGQDLLMEVKLFVWT